AALAEMPRAAPLPRRLVEQAVSLARALVEDPASTGTTIHGDLHYGNVLAADREPWLAIDPKPLSGDPHVEVVPMLWNRWDDVAGDVRAGVRRRFHALVDAAGLDEHRARDWVVVAMMGLAVERLADGPQVRRVTSTQDWLTRCVAVAKAVQD
ncbi:MAG: aminoglycoside phosphotransferase family protein, partial [Nocardioidaceae bacterium]